MARTRSKALKKVLFMTNSEYGQANVILAVVYELLQRQGYEVHVASFASIKKRVSEINDIATFNSRNKSSTATFHTIFGLSSQEAGNAKIKETGEFIGPFPPGLRGAKDTYRISLPALATVYDGPAYMAGYSSCLDIIDSIKPDLVACDPLLSQGLEACKVRSCNLVVLSPNTFREIMGKQQPMLQTLFRYPAFVSFPSDKTSANIDRLASAFPYPVPWHLVLANLYLRLSLIWILVTSPKVKELIAFRRSQNLPKLPPPFDIWQPENHYLVPSIPETDFPCYVAPNVTPCGPILLPETPIEESDTKLLVWLKQGPTVLINMGSLIRMDDAMVREFASALKVLLDSKPDVQVLWKLKKKGGISLRLRDGSNSGDVTSDSLSVIQDQIDSGRVKVEEWMSVDPSVVLQSGHVACSVHHGGSNSFHEALR
jgi:hypothetical protein